MKQNQTSYKSITNRLHSSRLSNSDDYDEKYMKIKFTSDDDLSQKKKH